MYTHRYANTNDYGQFNYDTHLPQHSQHNHDSVVSTRQLRPRVPAPAHQPRARTTAAVGIFPVTSPTTPAISDSITHNTFPGIYRYPPMRTGDNSISLTPDRQLASVNGVDVGSRSVNAANITQDGGVATVTSPSVYSSNGNINGRKRDASTAGLDTSPQSIEHNGDTPPPSAGYDTSGLGLEDLSARKRPVKRACNECRQQKVRPCRPAVRLVNMYTDACSSFAAMSFRTRSRSVHVARVSTSSAKSKRTSNASANAREMPRWSGRLSS